jgi:hypothetical protein
MVYPRSPAGWYPPNTRGAGPLLRMDASATVVNVMKPWLLAPVSVVGGVMALGCTSTPTVTQRSRPTSQAVLANAAPGTLRVRVISVTAALEPYNPQVASQGIPAEHVVFTVSGLPRSAGRYLHCTATVFHMGQQVGTTSFGDGAASSRASTQQLDVQVNGENFAGQRSDAHVVCSTTTDPVGGF